MFIHIRLVNHPNQSSGMMFDERDASLDNFFHPIFGTRQQFPRSDSAINSADAEGYEDILKLPSL